MIRVDNGLEFMSHQLEECSRGYSIDLAFIQPGKPMQNGFVERCNGNISKELLNTYVFTTLSEVKEKAEAWRIDYNCSRPYKLLGYVPPLEFINLFS